MDASLIFMVYPGRISSSGGGAIRAMAMCRALSDAGFVLDLASRDSGDTDMPGLNVFRNIYQFGSALPMRLKSQESIRSYIARKMDIEFNEWALELIDTIKPKAVITHYAWTAGVLSRLPAGVMGILDTIDIQYRRGEVARANGIANFDRQAEKREELRELRKADVLIAIQPDEQRLLQDILPGHRVICATHTMPVKPLASPNDSHSVFFVGSNYDPNIRGIERFVVQAWPRIREAVPTATLDICGQVCGSLYHLESQPGIHLHGMVDDLRVFYENAAVVVNPSLYGTGLPIKTSEALAYGKGLVCNTPSARGFDPTSFPGLVCEYSDMPERIIPLLQDTEKRRDLEAVTALYAKRYMTPEVIFGELMAVLREAADRPAPMAMAMPTPGLISRLRDYPLRKVVYYYATRLFSRLFQRSGSGGGQGGRLLEKYIRLHWRALARDEGVQRVAIYGAGKHSYWLAHVVRDEQDIKVVAVLDDHPAANREGPFHLTPILSGTFDPKSVDAIILSSDCIQEKLARRCRELYGQDVRLIDLYEGLPPGPYAK